MEIIAKDRYGKALAVGQRVRVVLGNPGWTGVGKVTNVSSGSSQFCDEITGIIWQRPNSDFQILEEK